MFQMEEPVDTFCTVRDMSAFDSTWQSTNNYINTQSIISAYFAGRSWKETSLPTFYWDATRAIELMLLALPIKREPPEPTPGSITFSSPTLKAQCDTHATRYNPAPCYYAPSDLGFITGMIDGHGSGMTTLGMALQCFVLVVSLVSLSVILGPRMPLLSEWPAQWIGLTAELPARDVIAAVAGTSMGQNHVRGQTEVFLSSVPVQQGVYLRLTKTQGRLSRVPSTCKVRWSSKY